MSARLKIFIVFTLSVFATAVVAGVYRIKQWHSNRLSVTKKQQPIKADDVSTQELLTSQYKGKYKSIPLTNLKSGLKGTDPAALAINAFRTNQSKELTRKVDVIYPQPNQAMVTITETNFESSESTPIKYRVKLTSFGRSILVNSPPLWQIVWAGSSEQCLAEVRNDLSTTACR